MKKIFIACLLFALAGTSHTRAQTAPDELVIRSESTTLDRAARAEVDRRLVSYEVIRLDFQPLADALSRGLGRHRLSIPNIIDQDVILERRDLRAPHYRLYVDEEAGLREVDPNYVPNTYVLRDLSGREIGRVNVDPTLFEARIQSTNDVHYIRQLTAYTSSPDPNIMIVSDSSASAVEQYCSTVSEALSTRTLTQNPDDSQNQGGETCLQLEIAGAGDYSLFQIYGMFGTQNRVFQVANLAESIMIAEFNLPFTITANVVSLSPDAYTSTDAPTLKKQFKEHWNEHATGIKRDVALLVSGKNFDGNTVGFAKIKAAGDINQAYAIVQSEDVNHLDHVCAHELGHSLGSDHDQDGCDEDKAKHRWTMCSTVGTKGFSNWSRNEIITYANENIDYFMSDYILTTSPFFTDGNFTNGELHAGNSITTIQYFLENPAHDVTLVARNIITLKANTRVTGGAAMVCRIDPNLQCTEIDPNSN